MLQYYTASANNWLDAVDASYCGGDDPTQVSGHLFSHLWPHLTVVNLFFSRMVYIQMKRPVGSMVSISSKKWSFNTFDNEHRTTIGPQACGITKPPNVISISYHENEGDVSLAYAQRQCWEYAKVRCVYDQLFLRFSQFTARNDGDICGLFYWRPWCCR